MRQRLQDWLLMDHAAMDRMKVVASVDSIVPLRHHSNDVVDFRSTLCLDCCCSCDWGNRWEGLLFVKAAGVMKSHDDPSIQNLNETSETVKTVDTKTSQFSYLHPSKPAAPTKKASGSSYAAVSNLPNSSAQMADSVQANCEIPDVFCGVA
jgi:hypothetical protein